MTKHKAQAGLPDEDDVVRRLNQQLYIIIQEYCNEMLRCIDRYDDDIRSYEQMLVSMFLYVLKILTLTEHLPLSCTSKNNKVPG